MSVLTPHFVYGGQILEGKHDIACRTIIDFLQRYALVEHDKYKECKHKIPNFKMWAAAMLKCGRHPRTCIRAIYEHLEGFFWLEDKKYRETLIYLFKRQLVTANTGDRNYIYSRKDVISECKKYPTKYSPFKVLDRGRYVTDGLTGMVLVVRGKEVLIHVNPCCMGDLYDYDISIGVVLGHMDFSACYNKEGFKQLEESRCKQEAIVQNKIMPVMKKYDTEIIEEELFCLAVGCHCVYNDYDSD